MFDSFAVEQTIDLNNISMAASNKVNRKQKAKIEIQTQKRSEYLAATTFQQTSHGNNISKSLEESLKFSLAEFTKIKEENIGSINAMHTTLNYGLAGMALLFGAIGQVWSQTIAPIALLLFATPILCLFIHRTWFAEVTRMGRASYFLWRLEKSLNKFFQELYGDAQVSSPSEADFNMKYPLRWEGWVRGENATEKNNLMKPIYLANSSMLLSVVLLSLLIGDIRLYLSLNLGQWLNFTQHTTLAYWLTITLSFIWNIIVIRSLYRERRQVKNVAGLYGASSTKTARSGNALEEQ